LDVSSKENDRIYGTKWFAFLGNCKATLGSESGSNVFDFDGNLEEVEKKYRTFKDFEAGYLSSHPEFDFMGQISPRIFESAAMRTLSILYPGSYSGLIKPWVHYVPLERDLSNSVEVLDALKDHSLVGQITNNASRDLIESERYSKHSFTALVETVILSDLKNRKERRTVLNLQNNLVTRVILTKKDLSSLHVPNYFRFLWRLIPFNTRIKIVPHINQIINMKKKKKSS
jgi:hypothetical protein